MKKVWTILAVALVCTTASAQQAAYTSILFGFKFKYPATRVYTDNTKGGSSSGGVNVSGGDSNVSVGSGGVSVNTGSTGINVPADAMGECTGKQEIMTWEDLGKRNSNGKAVYKEFMGLTQKNGWKFKATVVSEDGGTYTFTKQKRAITGVLTAGDSDFRAVLCEGRAK
jgi:uncharacterized protein GlcG (DUF336 family)